ncbi:MAG: tetraacyldisaccharide 4'-kinase [Proteobacteria bacterium]|nr:tetraacyldisaccharide 4'-kinase [Pseudomonadota bacterium]NOG59459.1 tetraacyldisaccharide 4'-kinase [Pseudomonadota bacterium]
MLLSKEFIEEIWQSKHPLGYLLLPLSWIYKLIIILRRLCYQSGLIAVNQIDVPVIIVGNISVGGTGKTPLVVWLADYFKNKGFKPGIVSRGYGGQLSGKTQQVRPDSDPRIVGDEPVLISKRTACPVAVAVKRRKAAEELIEYCDCDLILCDDGLQHYSLARDIEISVIDGQRRFGNNRCLPAGPLREPISRLKSVDFVVSKYVAARHEYKMEYSYGDLVSLTEPVKTCPVSELAGESVHVIAGIGNPDRYFSYLRNQKIKLILHEFPDHHAFIADDINFNDGLPVVMTEKDAVKCTAYATQLHWYLPITATLPDSFTYRLDALMKDIINGQKTT